jgi:4-carboxymuconolactone decarboxylase
MSEAPRFPFAEISADIVTDLAARGGRPVNLYRTLANAPEMLRTWIDFAWSLRQNCRTPRPLRELMILRTAQLQDAPYEWQQHLVMARAAGVRESQLTELAMWRHSTAFDERERTALALTEAIVAGRVDERTHAETARVFDREEHVELILTAAAYCMVARVLDALDVSTKGEDQ